MDGQEPAAMFESTRSIPARLVPEEERSRADRLLRRLGVLATVVIRPVPILADTTALVAGTSSLGWRASLLAALVGSRPAALLYAVPEALTASLATGAVVFAVVTPVGWWSSPCRPGRDASRRRQVPGDGATDP